MPLYKFLLPFLVLCAVHVQAADEKPNKNKAVSNSLWGDPDSVEDVRSKSSVLKKDDQSLKPLTDEGSTLKPEAVDDGVSDSSPLDPLADRESTPREREANNNAANLPQDEQWAPPTTGIDAVQFGQDPQQSEKNSIKSEADRLYEEGMKMWQEGELQINVRRIAFQLIQESARQGNLAAREWYSLGTLLGWGLYQSLPTAMSEFQDMARKGNPRGQFGLGLMYASGLLVNASVPHALVYFTFSALGGDNLAQMALAYRHWTGTGVEENCEAALTHYHRVAKKVADEVSARSKIHSTTMTGPFVRRARLLDEADSNSGLLSILFGVNGGFSGLIGNGGVENGDVADGVLGGLTEDLFQYYQFMADKKNTSAQVGLGQLYYYGRHGVEKNWEKAFYYFTLAAESGSALAKAYLGEMYMLGSSTLPADPTKGLAYLRQSAEEGNAIGQTGLANVYLYGKGGVAANAVKAMELLIKAAEQGWSDAQLWLGRMFMGTLGMKADYKLALKYFTRASQQGNILAFFYLAEMHATGLGVLRSCETATELFKNVAERGNWSQWFMYAHSAYRARRYDEAFMTYQLLAELGYEVAQSNVAFMLEEGKITAVDKSELRKRAFVQWKRSASQGSPSSRIKVGDYYYYGWGIPSDHSKAAQQYRVASEVHHSSHAMFNLAYMHEQGLGMKRDIHLAKRYYDMASEASIEARIPVNLALMKLSVSFSSEYLKELSVVKALSNWLGYGEADVASASTPSSTNNKTPDPSRTMDWDFYAIPTLAGLLLALIVFLRNFDRRP